MQVITKWTGGHADALRQSLRMTNESFAESLCVAVRTVAYWREKPEITPNPKIQEALDVALERAPDRAKAQFSLLVGEAEHGNRIDHLESFGVPGGSLLDASFDAANPEFGDSDYLQSVRSHIREIVALDNRFGGADLVRMSTRFFRAIHDQLGEGTYDPKPRSTGRVWMVAERNQRLADLTLAVNRARAFRRSPVLRLVRVSGSGSGFGWPLRAVGVQVTGSGLVRPRLRAVRRPLRTRSSTRVRGASLRAGGA
jgi:hypothetical protein